MIAVPGRRRALLAAPMLAALVFACGGETPAPPASPGPAEPAGDPASRLRVDAYGATWTPAPGDGAMLDASSNSRSGLEVEGSIAPAREPSSGFGLAVTVAGEARIVLPGTWREARVEAEIEIEGPQSFDGSIAVELRGVELDRASIEAEAAESRPEGPFVLALALSETGGSETGSSETRATAFFDGKVTAETVFDSAPAEGRAGLRLHGEGTLRLRRLQVVRLASEPSEKSE